MVDVFDEVARLVEPARAEVDRQHHLGAGLFGPVGEFVDADLVGLGRAPGKVEPRRAVGPSGRCRLPSCRPRRNCRPDSGRSGCRASRTRSITSPRMPLRVGGRMAGLVDAGIDRAAEMLEERAVEPLVDVGDRIGRVRRDPGFHAFLPAGFHIRRCRFISDLRWIVKTRQPAHVVKRLRRRRRVSRAGGAGRCPGRGCRSRGRRC